MDGGLIVDRIYGIEGPGVLIADVEGLCNAAEARERLLVLAREADRHPLLMTVSSHLLAIGRKSGGVTRRVA